MQQFAFQLVESALTTAKTAPRHKNNQYRFSASSRAHLLSAPSPTQGGNPHLQQNNHCTWAHTRKHTHANAAFSCNIPAFLTSRRNPSPHMITVIMLHKAHGGLKMLRFFPHRHAAQSLSAVWPSLCSFPCFLTQLQLFLCIAPVWQPPVGPQHSSPTHNRADTRNTDSSPHTWAIHFDSSFSYCYVVDAPMFKFKVHLIHVSGVRWRFNWLHQTPVW